MTSEIYLRGKSTYQNVKINAGNYHSSLGHLMVILYKHGVVTEEQIKSHCHSVALEEVDVLMQSNRKKSAQTSVLGKRTAGQACLE